MPSVAAPESLSAGVPIEGAFSSVAVSAVSDGDARVGDASRMRRALLLPGTAALLIGVVLAAWQYAAWLLVIPELAVGALLGFALVPLRRHPDVPMALERVATGFFVLAAYEVYVIGSCAWLGVTPFELFAQIPLPAERPTLERAGFGAGFGAGLFAFKIGVSWTVARAVLRLSGDESAHEYAAASADGRWF